MLSIILSQENGEINKLSVNISTSVQTIIDIEERSNTIELKFKLTVEWPEYRAVYHNLKTKNALNVLSNNELQQIWIPFIVFKVIVHSLKIKFPFDFHFENTDAHEAVTIDGVPTTAFVKREGTFSRGDSSYVNEVEIFQGLENRITMIQTYNKRFQCTYQLHSFPFDTQV